MTRLPLTVRRWFVTTRQLDPVLVVAEPLAYLFAVGVAIGPFVAVLLWQRPPLIVGLVAALWGFGAVVRLFTEGFAARALAIVGRKDLSGLLHSHSWVLVVRSFVATFWLMPVIGIWSAAIEGHLHPDGARTASEYAVLALWYVGNIVPLLSVPRTLGYPDPPVESWSPTTGVALLVLGTVFIYSIVLVVTELVARRT